MFDGTVAAAGSVVLAGTDAPIVAQTDPLIGAGMVVFVGLFVLIGLAITVWGAGTFWTGLQIRRADLDAVADATDGRQVELEGVARRADGAVTGPFTGEDCLAHRYRVERYSADSDGSSWKTVERGGDAVPFLLECENGDVLVRADRDPDLALDDDHDRVVVAADEDPPEGIARYLAEESTPDDTDPVAELGPVTVGGQRRRYTEVRLVEGETAFVSGVARARTSATDVPMPRTADAAVGPPEVSGTIAGLRRRVSELPFVVADSPADEAWGRQLLTGGVALAFGLSWTLFSAFGFLVAVGALLGSLA